MSGLRNSRCSCRDYRKLSEYELVEADVMPDTIRSYRSPIVYGKKLSWKNSSAIVLEDSGGAESKCLK